MLGTLETKLNDKSWTDTQDAEFVNLLSETAKSVHNLATRTYILVDLIDTFYDAVFNLFQEESDTATDVEQNGQVYPSSDTNFSAEPK